MIVNDPTETHGLVVRELTMADRAAMIELFNEVFAPNTMTPELWDWKYAEGRGIGVGAWSHDRLVGHYGGVFRDILVFGKLKRGVQVTDAMVHPSERARFSKRGAYFLTGSTFLARHVGDRGTAWIGFGFPHDRVYRLMKLLGLGTSVGEIVELYWRPGSPQLSARALPDYLPATEFAQQRRAIDRLGERMANDLRQAVLGVRDAEYFRHRFAMHPTLVYHVVILRSRFFRIPVAMAVVREEPECLKIIDVFGELSWANELVAAVRRAAFEMGGRAVSMWISRHLAGEFDSASNAELRELGVCVPHNTWSAGCPPEFVANKWFLMAGDTDFL